MQALGFLRRSLDDPAVAAQVAYCSYFIDTWVVMPGLLGCILTGLFYSMRTSIGFFKFAWIGYKWLISLSAGFWGVLFWGPWGDELIATLQPWGIDWPLRMVRACILPQNIWTGLLQTAIILSMCLISVYRPISFRVWLRGTEHSDLARRIDAVRATDRDLKMQSPQANLQVRNLYQQWLGEPYGELSHRHLHTCRQDRSQRLAALRESGLYPPKKPVTTK